MYQTRKWLVRGAHSYSKTLNLPKSSLPNRPDRSKYPALLKQTGDDLYRWQLANNEGPTHILHDGPPYANGVIHLGHALNKILKDLINRYNTLRGRKVVYIPGWDCHGLPIEMASLEKARKKGKMPKSITERRNLAETLALEMVEKQKKGFREFGVMADWDNESSLYKTMNSDYVVRQLRVFASMMQRGLVFRQRKPVYWSVESGTALAESELQYGDHTSTSIYVKFPVSGQSFLPEGTSFAIWTTTPWTLPANKAIAVHPDLTYALIATEHGKLVVAENLATNFTAEPCLETFKGSDLVGLSYVSPLTGETCPVISADHVTDSSGTGLVHTAPGHGKEDYIAGLKFKLDIYSPVDDKGRYSTELHSRLSALVGLDVRKEGTPKVLELLEPLGAIFGKESLSHSVPFDWRSKTPVMVRSTPQFFIDLGDVRQKALAALSNVKFKPESGEARLRSFIMSRSDWCVSRQRVWGVPIPVLHHKTSEDILMQPEVTDHIISRIESYGDAGLKKWFEEQDDVSEWLPDSLKEHGMNYKKGTDTMDVWFDSGTSWTQIPGQEIPVSYYLEGSDQHRGWFQSSLLTHVAFMDRPVAPYKELITHGFTLDENMQKMSKSLKNVVSPEELINGNAKFPALGIDGLRLFIAQTDYTSDVALSPVAVNQVAATVKKMRLTFKFLLGNLTDYTPVSTTPQLSPMDKYALSQLAQLVIELEKAYEEHNFSHVVKLLQNHMNGHLSAFYFDIAKDILYTDSPDSSRRRAIQYVLHQILNVYSRVFSPIMPLMSQEVWNHSPKYITEGQSSPFHARWPEINVKWASPQLDQEFLQLQQLRKNITEVIELARGDKKVGSSLACDIYIEVEGSDRTLLEKYQDDLASLLIVSRVHLMAPSSQLEWVYTNGSTPKISAGPAEHHKCPRCWQYVAEEEDTLCKRCETAVESISLV